MKVKIYTTPTCPYCKLAKEFLNKNKVEFENIDVTANDDAMKEAEKISGQRGVPVIDIDGKVQTGFDEEKLSAALGIK
jgi:glutaredoxin-like YruB-family protein